jgi:hypothetical protein
VGVVLVGCGTSRKRKCANQQGRKFHTVCKANGRPIVNRKGGIREPCPLRPRPHLPEQRRRLAAV